MYHRIYKNQFALMTSTFYYINRRVHNSNTIYHINFSKPHKPDEKWPLYSRSSPHYYTYTADGTSGPAGPRGPRASACAFWNDFLNKLNGETFL